MASAMADGRDVFPSIMFISLLDAFGSLDKNLNSKIRALSEC
jgi:hypothetical protein